MSTAKAPAAPSGRICEKDILFWAIFMKLKLLAPLYVMKYDPLYILYMHNDHQDMECTNRIVRDPVDDLTL